MKDDPYDSPLIFLIIQNQRKITKIIKIRLILSKTIAHLFNHTKSKKNHQNHQNKTNPE
jgi:hypothetical protein